VGFLVISILIFNIIFTLVSLVFMHPFMDMFAVFDLYIFMVMLASGFGLCRFIFRVHE